MTTPRCPRCGDPFDPRTADQVRCLPCAAEIAEIVAADAKRKAPRMPAKDYTWMKGTVL